MKIYKKNRGNVILQGKMFFTLYFWHPNCRNIFLLNTVKAINYRRQKIDKEKLGKQYNISYNFTGEFFTVYICFPIYRKCQGVLMELVVQGGLNLTWICFVTPHLLCKTIHI